MHKLLLRQIKKFIPDYTNQGTNFDDFLLAISDSYSSYERDKELSNHAFSLSEKEYNEINQILKSEVNAKKISIVKLKEAIKEIDFDSKLSDSDDDLISIAEYVQELVAKRKNIETELVKNVNRITSLISNLQSGVLVENEKREVVFTNQTFCNMFGINAAPTILVGIDCSQSAEENKHLFIDEEAFKERIERLLKVKKQVTGDVLLLKDGRVFERDFVPVFVENEYRGHLWNYTDVTEKKKYLDAVAASEEKYRSIIANMNLGLLEVDNNDIVQYCNQSFTHISGYSLDEIKGKKASQLFISSVEMQSQVDEKHKVRNEGKSDSYEIQIKNKNGEQRWWLISGAPNYNDQKELIGSIGIHLDITEQKRLERELEIALLKAQDASKAKEVFLANMSHEIRTPLNAIIGMIRELGRENLTPKQNSYLENCKTAAKHLLSIVNNILDMSKIEAGEFELDNQDFSLASVINMAQSILHAKAAEKNLLLLINIAPEIKPALIGDGSRIRQILINLLGNSIKFTERGFVELKVEAKHTNPYFQQLLFRIHDTGIGMSNEFLNSVFDKFSQEDTEAGRKFEGTGLGMAITKEMVNLMGGDLKISSEKGIGTTIEVNLTLPIGDEKKILSTKKIQIDDRLKGLHCLLVEDNDMNRLIATNSLKYFGCSVSEAADGQKAISLLNQRNDFDFILMDIQMPIMDGLECTKHIREILKNDVPIIALTANAFKSDIDLYLSIGMNAYVTKPFEEYILFDTIANTLIKLQPLVDKNSKSASSKEPTQLYDLSKIKDLSRGDNNFINKMINIFIEHTPVGLSEMKIAIDNNDAMTASKIAHKMKPSIDNMSISMLKSPIREIEAEGKSPSPNFEKIIMLYNNLEETLNIIVNQLKDKVKG